MTKKQLEHENKQLRKQLDNDRKYYNEIIDSQNKRITAYKIAWRRVHHEDQAFMFEFSKQNTDPNLFDVYNDLLYSFGRSDKNGIVFTRLDSWNK